VPGLEFHRLHGEQVARITHRRAGRHLPGRTRRDPRRVVLEKRGQLAGLWPAAARPEDAPSGEPGESLAKVASAA
jgi:hypothetical protein